MIIEELKGKTILLDTNVIIEFAKYPSSFQGFFDDLINNRVVPAVDESIKCEFLRKSNTLEKRKKKEDFLDFLLGTDENRTELKITNEIFSDATHLSNLFNFLNDKNNSSITDCLLAALLKKYENNLYLATINNKDFSIKIFDRVLICNIEIGDEIRNIGIYKFSKPKYETIVDRFC
jgi:predicted nucleic acid-binding protein